MPSGSGIEENVPSPTKMDIADRLHFPRWYWLATWWLPLSMGLAAGAFAGFALMGYFALPAALSMFAWAPTLFASLEGIASVVAITTAIAAVSSMSYLTSLLFARGLTAHIPEQIAKNTLRENAVLEKKLMSKRIKSEELEEKHHHELAACVQELQEMRTNYDRVCGEYGVRADNDVPTKKQVSGKRVIHGLNIDSKGPTKAASPSSVAQKSSVPRPMARKDS